MPCDWAGVSQGDFSGEERRHNRERVFEFRFLKARGVGRSPSWLSLRGETDKVFQGVTCSEGERLRRHHWYWSPSLGSKTHSPSLRSLPRKNTVAPALLTILIKCEWRQGQVSWAVWLKTFPTLAPCQYLFLPNSYPLWLGNEVSGSWAQHCTWQLAKDSTTTSTIWHWLKLSSEKG